MTPLGTTGKITTQDLLPAGGTPTTGSFVQLPPMEASDPPLSFLAFPDSGVSHVALSVDGTYTAVGGLIANGTVDGVNWHPLNNYPFVNQQTGLQSNTIPSGVTGFYTLNVVGLQAVRIDAQGAVTGTATVSINASTSTVGAKAAVNPTSNGSQYLEFAASSSDQVVSALPGSIVKVIPMTAGSAATSIYDNATAGSGTLLLTIPATPTVGVPYTLNLPCANGITIKGAANTSAVGVSFN
jgi:hypothetical protein